jgi:hypothetical protein
VCKCEGGISGISGASGVKWRRWAPVCQLGAGGYSRSSTRGTADLAILYYIVCVPNVLSLPVIDMPSDWTVADQCGPESVLSMCKVDLNGGLNSECSSPYLANNDSRTPPRSQCHWYGAGSNGQCGGTASCALIFKSISFTLLPISKTLWLNSLTPYE